MKTRKLRVYDINTEWTRIRVRMATKPDSIRVESAKQRAETFFEPVIDLKGRTIAGNTMVNPFGFDQLPLGLFL